MSDSSWSLLKRTSDWLGIIDYRLFFAVSTIVCVPMSWREGCCSGGEARLT